MEKKMIFCSNCGRKFVPVGREHICPSCKAQAAEDAKRAAVLKAKRASWAGESVPVRISGRASTIIRRYGAAHNLPFAQALDALLKASEFFQSTGKAWNDVTPYKSRRMKKGGQDVQAAQEALQEVKPVKPVKQAAKQVSKASASKPQEVKAAKKAVKTSKK